MSAPWEQFCKDEARRAAHEFLEKVRRLQTRDRSTMEIPESVFASKFSAHFMDEVIDLTGPASELVLPARDKKTGANKSWWNIFKRKQTKDEMNLKKAVWSGGMNQELGRGVSSAAAVIQESTVKMLDMNNSSQYLTWQPCRLVLTSEQGNHQLEVYTPPKVRERQYMYMYVREGRRGRGR